MPRDLGKQPTTRRYSAEEKAAAVRRVKALEAETGMTTGSVKRVADQLGYGVESSGPGSSRPTLMWVLARG